MRQSCVRVLSVLYCILYCNVWWMCKVSSNTGTILRFCKDITDHWYSSALSWCCTGHHLWRKDMQDVGIPSGEGCSHILATTIDQDERRRGIWRNLQSHSEFFVTHYNTSSVTLMHSVKPHYYAALDSLSIKNKLVLSKSCVYECHVPTVRTRPPGQVAECMLHHGCALVVMGLSESGRCSNWKKGSSQPCSSASMIQV